ncbi:MAG TPA: hypothetical protein VK439_01310 [Rubrivivax sp.]|nr:hypothetical protein [Rubrivivax sp.]
MDSIILWLVGGVAGLLLTAGAVALWEHLRRSVRPQDEFTSRAPKAVKIDLRLDRLPAQHGPVPAMTGAGAAATGAAPSVSASVVPVVALAPPPVAVTPVKTASASTSERAQRHAALEEVLARMSQPQGLDHSHDLPDGMEDSPRFWAETTPMVAPGQLEPHDPAPTRRPGPFSASRQP